MPARTVSGVLDPRAGGVVVAGEFEDALMAASAEHQSQQPRCGRAGRCGQPLPWVRTNQVGGVERGRARLPFRHGPLAYDFYGVACRKAVPMVDGTCREFEPAHAGVSGQPHRSARHAKRILADSSTGATPGRAETNREMTRDHSKLTA